MEENFVLNGNNLIAEFMGLIPINNNDDQIWYQVENEYILNNEFRYKNDIQYTTVDMLPYNVSWDWLMPCISKILEICCELDELEKYSIITDNIPQINNTYEEVIKFIKWYNNEKS